MADGFYNEKITAGEGPRGGRGVLGGVLRGLPSADPAVRRRLFAYTGRKRGTCAAGHDRTVHQGPPREI